MLTVAISKRNKLQNIIVLTPKDGECAESNYRKKMNWNRYICLKKELSKRFYIKKKK